MVAQEKKSVKIEDGSPASSSREAGTATSITRDEKPGRASSEGTGRNNNTNNGAKAATIVPLSYPAPHPHHAIHYFPPYPQPYDHSRVVVGSAAPPTNGEQGVGRPLPTAGPYTSAQFDRLKLPQSGMIPSHYPGTATLSAAGKPTVPQSAGATPLSGRKTSPPSAAAGGKKKNSNNLQSSKLNSSPTGPAAAQNNPARDPPPPMPHHFHHSGSNLVGPPQPTHHHYSAYPPPPREDHSHHHRVWAEYHNHYYDPATGGSYPPPPPGTYLPPPPPPDGVASNGGPYRFSDTTLRRDALSQLKNVNVSPHSQQYRRAMEIIDPDLDREGATSPSQIESSHREEVTTMGCTCKKTKCLKLYCQCFAVKIYCGVNCRCTVCQNTETHEKDRQAAIRSILSRNPQAFDTKFKKSVPDKLAVELAHKLGCKCRKSSCMKKYCECYAGGVRCTESCRCVGCKNNGRGAPGAGEAIANDAGPLAPTLFAAIAAQTKEEPLRKREPHMMDAAHNLAFLKHASPAPNKTGARRTPSQDGEASMPSLTSSEPSPNDSNPDEVPLSTAEKKRSVSEAPNTAERTAVNALLMAAVAMTEFSVQPPVTPSKVIPAGTEVSMLVSTPPDGRKTSAAPGDDYETPQKNLFKQFQSPKRKKSDTELDIDRGPMRSESGTSSSESSPSGPEDENENDDSPKRELAEMVVTPSVAQKIKRSRIGSVRKSTNRNLGAEMSLSEASPMVMETPKQPKIAATTALTPVSARCIDFKRMHVKGSPESHNQ